MRLTGIIDIIDQYARENNIIAGVCDAQSLAPLFAGDGGLVPEAPFIKYTAGQRLCPESLLPGAKSIIAVGAGCNREWRGLTDGRPRGRFSLNASGTDYHILIRDLLDGLEDALRQEGYVFECVKSVDTGPLPEKILAVKAGLGFIGKHGLVISEVFGSFFNIGYMITTLPDLAKPGDVNITKGAKCGKCNMCIRACPGGALNETNGSVAFDYTRCVSYLTQKKGRLTAAERLSMGVYLYGCDACQTACSYNTNTYIGVIRDIEYVLPLLDDIDRLTKSEFVKRYKSTAIYWRGLEVLKRNAVIARENFERNNEYFTS